jgi:TatD DNase family protein
LSGIVTFPRSAGLREVASFVPADRLLVETDAPYLAPVPHRGRRNEPAWVADTLRTLAGVRSVPVETLAAQVVANTVALMPAFGAVS